MASLTTNLAAINAQHHYKLSTKRRTIASEKLASGFRINRAADDAAGLSISEGMRAQIRGLNQGARNVQDGISLLNVADGALNEVHEMLARMNELCIQAATDTYTFEDRETIQQEINQLKLEIDRIGTDTEFNTIPVFQLEPRQAVTTKVSLVQSPSAATGYLTEVVKEGSMYYPSSSLDFSTIDENSAKLLYNKSFSFYCSQNCDETFTFKFINGNGTQSSVAGQNSGSNPHVYTIDINGVKNGREIVSRVYDYVHDNMPNNLSPLSDRLNVSHSNYMKKDGAKLTIHSTQGYANKTDAENKFKNAVGNSGKVDIASITGTYDIKTEKRFLIIHDGANKDQEIMIDMFKMDSEEIGLGDVDVTTQKNANDSIDFVNDARKVVSEMRASFGASTNRLEHMYTNNLNTAENLQNSESIIRDANIAEQMMNFAKESIMMQAGEAMMSMANKSSEGILQLLK